MATTSNTATTALRIVVRWKMAEQNIILHFRTTLIASDKIRKAEDDGGDCAH
jgi:hypothetical protein